MKIVLGRQCSMLANALGKSGEKVIGYLPDSAADEPFHKSVTVVRSPSELIKTVVELTELGETLSMMAHPETSDVGELKTLAAGLETVFRMRQLHLVTVAKWDSIWTNQAIQNLPTLARLNAVGDLRLDGATAVIVGAGPSLDKNIKQLRRAKGKALIIALQRVAHRLCKAGIIPDAVIVVDAGEVVLGHLDGLPWGEIPLLILEQSAHPAAFDIPARILWFEGRGGRINIPSRIIGYSTSLQGGGTVASSAVGAAVEMGCDRIVMVGTDLAYGSDGNRYSDGTEASERSMMKLRDWDCSGVVSSPMDFVATISFLSSMAEIMSSVRFYNCTEGGAFIEGFTHVKLKKVMGWLCRPLDLRSAILDMPDRGRGFQVSRMRASEFEIADPEQQDLLDKVCLRGNWRY